MKGRHQFRRRFSLQPSFLKEEPEEDKRVHNPRYENTFLILTIYSWLQKKRELSE
jgi:hypothetical protein